MLELNIFLKGVAFLMIPEVTVQTLLGVIGEDTVSLSSPLKVLCSNGKVYVLKPDLAMYQGQPIILDSVMLNEAFGSFILSRLNLTTPSFAKLTLDDSFFISNHSVIGSTSLMYRTDFPYFVTEYIDGDDGMLHRTFKKYIDNGKFEKVKAILERKISHVSNDDEFALSILADIFILNTDRFSNVGNLVFSHDNKVHWIDHGFAFLYPAWRNKSTLFMDPDVNKIVESYYDSLFNNKTPFLLKVLDSNSDWTDDKIVSLMTNLSGISDFSIRSFLNDLPDEWYSDPVIQKRAINSLFKNQIERTILILKKLLESGFLNNLQQQGGVDLCTLQEDTGTQ